MPWLDGLGVEFRLPEEARVVDKLYGLGRWPDGFDDTLVIWFGLDKAPPVPQSGNLWFLPGIEAGRRVSPRALYLEGLAKRGVPADGDWLAAFRELFARDRKPGNTILLFPGAGHARKAWPLVKYLELASKAAGAGLSPLFVLGPAETEQGVTVHGFPVAVPESLAALQELLLGAAAAVGGDTGPLHLAGMLGVPTVSLFGPTDPRLWAPTSARVITAPADCAPCAALATHIDCASGGCLDALEAGVVWEVLSDLLGV
jgi:hypothetical protein